MEERRFPQVSGGDNDQETRYYGISSSKFVRQRGHSYAFPAEKMMTYPNIALHFGHLIPMCKSMFPARNNVRAPYNNVLNSPGEMYFSVNANIPSAKKPTATRIKYNFFSLLILSLGFILSLSAFPVIKCRLFQSHSLEKGIDKSAVLLRSPVQVPDPTFPFRFLHEARA